MSRLLAPLTILSAVALAYANAFLGTFQFDDYNVIVHNPAVTHWPPALAGLRPLLKLSYALNWALGPRELGFHAFNVVVHGLNALLVFALGIKLAGHFLDRSAAHRAAWIGALLFALHPVHTEAVTYISGRSSSLMAMFYFASLLAYVHGRELASCAWLWFFSPLLFALALLSKETALTLPFALLLWEICCRRERRVWSTLPHAQWVHWALLLAATVVIALHPAYRELIVFAPSMDTLRTQVHGIGYLLSRWVALGGLNIDPDLRVQMTWSALLLAQTTVLALLLAVGVWALRARPWLGFGILWLFLQLLPGNTAVLRWDIANERQLYLAGVGLFIVAGIEAERLKRALPRAWVTAMLAVLLPVLATFTFLRNLDYGSEVRLWEDAARKSPHKARVHNNLGDAYLQAEKRDKARASFLRALELDPDYLLARNNLRALEAATAAPPR